MYAAERQAAIEALVVDQRRISVTSAAETFGVTTETVRRDLAALEERGRVHRVHGGAVCADALSTVEPAISERLGIADQQKDRIARAALRQLPGSNGSILLDAGTTTERMSAYLPADTHLRMITNAPAVATVTARLPHLELHILGGRIRPASRAAVGPRTLSTLADLRVDVAFLGTNGLSIERGVSTPDPDEAAVKSAMIAAGRRVVVMADSRKFGEDSMMRFGTIDTIDTVITDDNVDDADVTALEALGIEVVVA